MILGIMLWEKEATPNKQSLRTAIDSLLWIKESACAHLYVYAHTQNV